MNRAVPVMEVWPSGFAVWAGIPNHRKLRRLSAGVVSVAGKGPLSAGQVCDGKTNVCEPLLTHRQTEQWHQNRGGAEFPGQRRAVGGVLSAVALSADIAVVDGADEIPDVGRRLAALL